VSVFLALAFAFYVFFAPFVGRKVFQYVVMGLYTPLVRAPAWFLRCRAASSERLVCLLVCWDLLDPHLGAA
jgi:palmitoyltransferase ZDHHC1/11